MKRRVALVLGLIIASLITAGCGETVNGLSRDINRIGKGIKTVFMRGE
jgi:predicted small secreted protein